MSDWKGYKLFIDDVRPIPEGWIGARTVSEAIAILASLKVEVVSLDHDILSGVNMADPGYRAMSMETFRGVAYYIAAIPPEYRPRVMIHTGNAGGAASMCDIMKVYMADAYRPYKLENYADTVRELRDTVADK